MTKELHKIIIRAALDHLLTMPSKIVNELTGFPVDKDMIRWCAENPEWEDVELRRLIKLLEKTLSNSEENP